MKTIDPVQAASLRDPLLQPLMALRQEIPFVEGDAEAGAEQSLIRQCDAADPQRSDD